MMETSVQNIFFEICAPCKKPQKCEQFECKKQPHFNHEGESIARFCSQHKDDGMVDVISKRCENLECKKRPHFNHEWKSVARFCSQHKEMDMVDVISKRCEQLECKKLPTYNYEGKTRKFCNEHKQNGMVNVKGKRCEYTDCKKQPIYNYEGKPTGIFCSEHKKDNMVDVNCKRCEYTDCKKIPTFNHKGQIARFCSQHKEIDMVDVKNKRCEYPNCTKHPHFNIEGESAKFCSEHKYENMVNVVKNYHKCCEYPNCNKRPHFNHEGEITPRFCNEHKENCMVNVVKNNHKCCEHSECKKRPYFNYEGVTTGRFCNEHKKEGMINVKDKRCLTHLCDTLATNKKYRGHCLRCFIHLFPEEPVTRNYKTKERAVTEYLLEHFQDKTCIVDKRIQDGCSRRRPDTLFDLGYQVVLVETDENKHEEYECSCENRRIMELSQDVGHRPMVIVRFNPDAYMHDGVRITSCWGTDGNGILRVPKKKTQEWIHRLSVLKDQIRYWMDNRTDKTVEVIQLFYGDE